jgi:putative addiction module CopG family antidote
VPPQQEWQMPQITLDAELAQFIEQEVASGRFRSASDVVRAGLELLDDDAMARRRAAIRTDLQGRAAHNGPWLSPEEAFADLGEPRARGA